MHVTAQFSRAISRQIFQPAYRTKADMKHWDWEQLTTVRSSDAALEQDFGYTGIGPAVATPEGGAAYYGQFKETATTQWTHTKYTLGAIVTQEMIEDNKNLPSIVSELGDMIGEGQSYVVDYTVAQILNRAFNGSYTLPVDSVALCSNSHELQNSGATIDNYLAGMSLTFGNLWTAINYFEYGMFTHENLPTKATPKYLIYHPSQNKVVRKLLETDKGEPDTANNNKNTLTSYNIVPIPCRFLTSTYWFLASDKFKQDLIFYWRIRKEAKEDTDFDRDSIKLKTRQRFSVNVRSGLQIVGSDGA